MKEVSKTGHFTIDLPSSDAATALSGPGNSFLKKFESLTGVSLTIRGLQLEMNGVISKIERASALVELTRPIWEQGLEVPEVDLKAALSSLNMGEIINADSMQVYKEFKILSARPDPKKYQKIKHHLYGFHNVTKNFSTGDWLKLAIKKIKEVQNRKKTPILVGGTGLYFKALTDGLVKIPNISLKLRNQIRDLQKKLGQKKFYEKLLKLDPSLEEK